MVPMKETIEKTNRVLREFSPKFPFKFIVLPNGVLPDVTHNTLEDVQKLILMKSAARLQKIINSSSNFATDSAQAAELQSYISQNKATVKKLEYVLKSSKYIAARNFINTEINYVKNSQKYKISKTIKKYVSKYVHMVPVNCVSPKVNQYSVSELESSMAKNIAKFDTINQKKNRLIANNALLIDNAQKLIRDITFDPEYAQHVDSEVVENAYKMLKNKQQVSQSKISPSSTTSTTTSSTSRTNTIAPQRTENYDNITSPVQQIQPRTATRAIAKTAESVIQQSPIRNTNYSVNTPDNETQPDDALQFESLKEELLKLLKKKTLFGSNKKMVQEFVESAPKKFRKHLFIVLAQHQK